MNDPLDPEDSNASAEPLEVDWGAVKPPGGAPRAPDPAPADSGPTLNREQPSLEPAVPRPSAPAQVATPPATYARPTGSYKDWQREHGGGGAWAARLVVLGLLGGVGALGWHLYRQMGPDEVDVRAAECEKVLPVIGKGNMPTFGSPEAYAEHVAPLLAKLNELELTDQRLQAKVDAYAEAVEAGTEARRRLASQAQADANPKSFDDHLDRTRRRQMNRGRNPTAGAASGHLRVTHEDIVSYCRRR